MNMQTCEPPRGVGSLPLNIHILAYQYVHIYTCIYRKFIVGVAAVAIIKSQTSGSSDFRPPGDFICKSLSGAVLLLSVLVFDMAIFVNYTLSWLIGAARGAKRWGCLPSGKTNAPQQTMDVPSALLTSLHTEQRTANSELRMAMRVGVCQTNDLHTHLCTLFHLGIIARWLQQTIDNVPQTRARGI